MKSFFYIVFGGLAAIGIGIGLAYGGGIIWRKASPTLSSIKMPSLTATASKAASAPPAATTAATKKSATPSSPSDATTISGLKRTVRYSASEEEDLISLASISLPSSSAKGVTAPAYIVKSITTGDTPVAHNADRIMPIASLSKLVTAIVARKLIDPNSRITLTRNIMATYGNTASFRVGETFTASDLYYPLLMVSSNDAAEAYAQYYGRAKFIQAMNDFTQSIGAYRTSFNDPSGLSPLNVSSADDLVLILKWIEKNDPGIIDITKLKTKTVRSHTWINPTHFLNWSNYAGGKNGYTPEADRTGVGLFAMDHNNEIYAVVVLGSEARDPDFIKLLAMVRK